jgi:hypothetical protein
VRLMTVDDSEQLERMNRIAGTGKYHRQRETVRTVIAMLCVLLDVEPGEIAAECSLLSLARFM